jgi:hypothetical protein
MARHRDIATDGVKIRNAATIKVFNSPAATCVRRQQVERAPGRRGRPGGLRVDLENLLVSDALEAAWNYDSTKRAATPESSGARGVYWMTLAVA